MNRLNRTDLTYTSLIALWVMLLALAGLARADDLTGLPVDDPKDLQPASSHATSVQPTGELQFVPMPGWARAVTLTAMPEQLKPMGKKTLAASGPVVPKVTPPKDESALSLTNGVETTSAGGKAAENSPAMITVSPFLQWIKSNPQAAATAARQQADAYHATPPGPGAPPAGTDQSYWLPPLIDSADFGTKPVGGSAAIYSTPQR
jgi:hypothetical protein